MFDEQPAGGIHGECAAEIHRLEAARAEDQARIAELIALLHKLAEHDQNCDVFDFDDDGCHKDCTCGLSQALSRPADYSALTAIEAGYQAKGGSK